MKFYYEKLSPSQDPVFFPTLILSVINPEKKKAFPSYKVLVDSGAAMCVFHSWVAEAIGIDFRSGKKISLTGATGGTVKMYIHTVKIVFGGYEMNLKVGFSDGLNLPMGILGQKGFFEKNRICFDLPVGDFEITPKDRK